MKEMFRNCHYLKTLDLSHFNISKLENMEEMFRYCTHLEFLDLTGWDISHAWWRDNMFMACFRLTEDNLITTDKLIKKRFLSEKDKM